MKKFIVYLILSVLLIVPIVSIIVIAIINQPINSYMEYDVQYDYSAVQTQEVQIKDIEEVINCKGKLTNSEIYYKTIKYKYSDTVIMTADVGDYVNADNTLVIKNGDKIFSGFEGKIIGITDSGDKFIYEIKAPTVNNLEVALPSKYYPYGQKFSPMTIGGIQYDEKEPAGKALLDACKAKTSPEPSTIGAYRGFTLILSFDTFSKAFQLTLKNVLSHSTILGSDVFGNISRIDNALSGLSEKMEQCKRGLEDLQRQVVEARLEVDKPFAQEQELAEKAARLAELDALLNMEKGSPEMLDGEPEQEDDRKIDYISR
jgi:hypothetical protein